MAGIIGRKIGMTSVFTAEGKNVPCTVIEAGPCVVTQVKTLENDGYSALQLAFDDKKEKHTTRPMQGHFKKAGTTPKRYLAEFKNWDKEYTLGDVLKVSDVLTEADEWVDIAGISKGKGFQGVVKRHGFNGVRWAPLRTLAAYSQACVWQGVWAETGLRCRICAYCGCCQSRISCW